MWYRNLAFRLFFWIAVFTIFKLMNGKTLRETRSMRSLIHNGRNYSVNENSKPVRPDGIRRKESAKDKKDWKKYRIKKPANYEKIVKEAMALDVIKEVNEGIGDEDTTGKAGTPDLKLRWEYYEMKIRIDKSFHNTQRQTIESALWTLGDVMKCFDFLVFSPLFEFDDDEDYLEIKRSKHGVCWSQLGRVGGHQQMQLSDECPHLYGTTLHEVMHALGFYHEHVRPDRDNYVIVNKAKLTNDFKKRQYQIVPDVELYSTPYDYKSIMHYPFNDIMRPIDSSAGKNAGQRNAVSEMDIKRLHEMYNCSLKHLVVS